MDEANLNLLFPIDLTNVKYLRNLREGLIIHG